MNDCFHLKKQLEIALESGKLNHLVKDVRQRGKGGQQGNGPQRAKIINMVHCSADRKRKTMMTDEKWMNVPITFPPMLARDLSEEALVITFTPKKQIHSPSSSSTTLSNSSQNQTCDLVSPSFSVYTPTPPQIFEIGKGSVKMQHHEEQIKDILNYLDELSLHRTEKMEEGRINGNELKTELKRIRTQIIKLQKKRMPSKRTSTSETPAITLDAIRQLIAGITAALEAQAAAMANTDNPNRNTKPREIPCAEEDRVTFATANQITWSKLKRLLTNKYCPQTEVKKMEDKLYGLTVNGSDLKTYIRRFKELAVLCPNMVPNTEKLMEAFIEGLPQSIEGNVTASKSQTPEEATNIAHRLMDQIIKRDSVQETNDHK
ncbi:reverse transcriptase domain-containing protein [Tanacetum coccineum]